MLVISIQCFDCHCCLNTRNLQFFKQVGFHKTSWLQLSSIAHVLTTPCDPLILTLTGTTHMLITWFILENDQFTEALLFYPSAYSLLSCPCLLLSFVSILKPCNTVGCVLSQCLHFLHFFNLFELCPLLIDLQHP